MKRVSPIAILAVAALASIAVGVTAQFGWSWAAIVIGAILWADLFLMGREHARSRNVE